jgi:hypothetical protein
LWFKGTEGLEGFVVVKKIQSNSGSFKEIGKKLPKTLVTLPTVAFAVVFADVSNEMEWGLIGE